MNIVYAKLVEQRLNCMVNQGYGMTEASPALIQPSLLYPSRDIQSVGVLLPNSEAMIVGNSSFEEGAGELYVTGPQIMKGYLRDKNNNSSITEEEAFWKDEKDSTRLWLKTGDVVREETLENGVSHFYIVDRIKDMIKYKSQQISPAELENVLCTHPYVEEAAVVRKKMENADEIPFAFVVVRKDVAHFQNKFIEERLLTYVSKNVAQFKRIRGIKIVESLPKSLAGKVLRNQLTPSL